MFYVKYLSISQMETLSLSDVVFLDVLICIHSYHKHAFSTLVVVESAILV